MEHHRLTEAEIDKMLIDNGASLIQGLIQTGPDTRKMNDKIFRFMQTHFLRLYVESKVLSCCLYKTEIAERLPLTLFRTTGTTVSKAQDYWAVLGQADQNNSLLCIELVDGIGVTQLRLSCYSKRAPWQKGHCANWYIEEFETQLGAVLGDALLTATLPEEN